MKYVNNVPTNLLNFNSNILSCAGISTSRRCSTGKGTTAEGSFDPSGSTT